ncbi:hypothetical protein [Variovorax sp. PBL-E5]|uniref:hypothetical protein n=1 Tax=Variovorax sp. PBL-E5 TaxID=434014 RepID=UPI001316B1CA|nr:hypothetical protein [Variovorax sp. PBL-E5]VTU35756.1 hypothetical protein E5CHR_04143 [Variovorax sp. PBL-E5]
MLHFHRLIALAGLALLLPLSTLAASSDAADMSGRYIDMQRCMERTMGKNWQQRYEVELARNRWGATEPTGPSIDSAPLVVRMTDMRCRREVNIETEPRP